MGKLVVIALTLNMIVTGYLLTSDGAPRPAARKTVVQIGTNTKDTGHERAARKSRRQDQPRKGSARDGSQATRRQTGDVLDSVACPDADLSHARLHGQSLDALDIARQAFETGMFDADGQRALYERVLALQTEMSTLFETWARQLAAC